MLRKIIDLDINVSKDADYSSPYWLKEESSLGMYTVNELDLIGLPETPNVQKLKFQFEYKGIEFSILKSITHKYC